MCLINWVLRSELGKLVNSDSCNRTLHWYKKLRNQRPTLVLTPDVSTSVKEIWIGNVLLLETFLVKFLPAPEPFRLKDALGWVWGFFIYLFLGSFDNPEQGGGIFVSES